MHNFLTEYIFLQVTGSGLLFMSYHTLHTPTPLVCVIDLPSPT